MLILEFLENHWKLIVFIIWCFIALIQQTKRDEVREKLSGLLSNPVINATGKDGAIYSRDELKKISDKVSNVMVEPIENWLNKQREIINKQFNLLYSGEINYLKLFIYVVFLVLFICFLWGDGIAIANTLELIGLISYVPSWLTQYEIAIMFGSLIPIIVGGFIISNLSERNLGEDKDENQKSLRKILSIVIIVLGLIALISLGIARYQTINRINISNETNKFIESFIIDPVYTILIPLNSALAAFLIHSEFFLGLQVLFLVGTELFLLLPTILLYLLKIIGQMGVFGLDIVIRVFLGAIYVLAFFFFTPLDAISNILTVRHSERIDK